MAATWVVVAHQAGARFFERTFESEGKPLLLVRELEHAEGRKKNSELDSDRAGESFTGMRGNTGRRAMGREESAHEHLAATFAKKIAHELDSARKANQIDQLILVAEPRFLGVLKGALDTHTARLVKTTLTKDLGAIDNAHLAPHLSEVLK